MKGFIEIVGKDNKTRLLNVRYIEEVCEIGENHCDIYLAFNLPDAYEQDHYQVRLPYSRVVELIREAME